MGFGYTAENALWIEAYFRGQEPVNDQQSSMESWSPELKRVHEEFSTWCEGQSHAKLEIYFGARNKEDHQQRRDMVFFHAVAGAGMTVSVGLQIKDDAVVRLHLYQSHPQYLFHVKSDMVSTAFDRALGLAAYASGLKDMKFSFFHHFSDALEYLSEVTSGGTQRS